MNRTAFGVANVMLVRFRLLLGFASLLWFFVIYSYTAINIQSPSDLVTLTAAAATALRGEAAVKARFTKDAAKKNAATVIPCEKYMFPAAVYRETANCTEDMLQQVYKGGLRWHAHINSGCSIVIFIDNIGGDSNDYTESDFDDIREEWAGYVSNFIFLETKKPRKNGQARDQ